jgi:hypothetical protein
VTGVRSSLVRDVSHRAEGDASLFVALAALVLVPLPALLASIWPQSSHVGMAGARAVIGVLVAATPTFALLPFVLGCGIGTLLHLAVTAPARFAAIRADREAYLGGRSLVAMSLLVGEVFAASGLVAAIAIFGVR